MANIAISIVRIKVMAVLLGTAGVGLAGLYGSISDLILSIAGMGVSSSGVRQIAEAAGSNNIERIARTGVVLRRTSILLGAVGALLLLVFSRHVSVATFGSDRHAGAVSLLSIAVFFRLVSAGQSALINGMRRISDLARMNVLGALLGTAFSIVIVYFLRDDGIVPSLIAVAFMTTLASWWYSRKIHLQTPRMTTSQVMQETTALLKLGFAFMASGLMTMGAAYVVRITILRTLGVESAGIYHAAWTLGGLYVGFILQAMGADFYPRLTAVADDNRGCNRLVNEQARIGLLLGVPGLIATLTLAPIIINLFYSVSFHTAVDVLRWICLGGTLRVVIWPMGFIILAKGKQTAFFWTELAWTLANVGLTWIFIDTSGLKGAGIAFFGSYVFHGCIIYFIARKLSGFRWSPENKQTSVAFLGLTLLVFCGFYALPIVWAACLGAVAFVLSAAYSLRLLLTFFSLDRVPQSLRLVLLRIGLVAPA